MKYNMQDGRAFTDFRSNCLLFAQLQNETGIFDEYEFRQFLQKNSFYRDNGFGVCPYCQEPTNDFIVYNDYAADL